MQQLSKLAQLKRKEEEAVKEKQAEVAVRGPSCDPHVTLM